MHNIATRHKTSLVVFSLRKETALQGRLVVRRDGPARLSRRATTQPHRTVLLKAIEWSTPIKCPASSLTTVFARCQHANAEDFSDKLDFNIVHLQFNNTN